MSAALERLKQRLSAPATEEDLAGLVPEVAEDWNDGGRMVAEMEARKPVRPTVRVAKPGQVDASPRPFVSMAESAPRGALDGINPEVLAHVQRSAGSPEPVPDAGDADFRAAQEAAKDRARSLAFGRAGAMVNEAISGARFDRQAYDDLGRNTDAPVRELAAQRTADKQKRLTDASSEESRRFQAAVSKALPGVYTPEEIAQMAAGDEALLFRAGEMRQRLDQRRAEQAAAEKQRAEGFAREDARTQEARAFQAQQAALARGASAAEAAKQRAFQERMAGLNNAADLEQAALRSRLGPNGQPLDKGTVIPGMEVAPGAAPTAEDAKKVKAAASARERLNTMANELAALHEKHGTEFGGEAAARMSQLSTALQLEAKTLAELGALTGPDMDLMVKLTGNDPSSLGANLKALVGMDTTQANIKGVKEWGGGLADATARAYGYQPAGGAPAKGPALPPPPPGEVRVRLKDGTTGTIPAAELEQYRNDPDFAEVVL